MKPHTPPAYDDASLQSLFDRMGKTYDFMNVVTSFGFSELWRWICVRNAGVKRGDRICDLMAGSGECWRYVLRAGGTVTAVDFSKVMVGRQRARLLRHPEGCVEVREENALKTSLADGSMDGVIVSFGLKTLRTEDAERLAVEIHRLLKPGGRFSLIEISAARGWWLGSAYRWYLRAVVPLLGRLCMGDIDCYRMLSSYATAFGSCEPLVSVFARSGLKVELRSHFFGCATSLVGRKE
jgi:demethylmenaquinone methyltransferase / 2-methoxy-6-polyprenyl-1,4-benzoquinol methylase